jgi:ribonuclease-3 family protein
MKKMDKKIFLCKKKMEEKEARLITPISLAFVGDAVQTLFVRETLILTGESRAGNLHKEVSDIINAVSQAEVCERRILPHLTEAETDIYRRGRNHKNNTIAKNAGVVNYKKATGFEAVVGYLYLTGQEERLQWILGESIKIKGE